jgi:hypothetical protein
MAHDRPMEEASAGASVIHSVWAVARRLRLARLIGLACFATALLTHMQEGHRVTGKWTLTGFVGILSVFVWLAAAWNSWRTYRVPDARSEARLRAALLDAAVLLWGVGYLLGVLDTPETAGNVYRLIVLGSATPATIVLYWCSLAALFVAGTVWVWQRASAGWANLGVSLATGSLLLLVGEGAVRARDLLAPATQGFPTYDTALWGRRYVRFNRNGFRDADHLITKAPGSKRVLLIGDSFAFGAGLRRTQDRLGEQLVLQLDRATGISWEVINASHPDLHTLNEAAILDSTLAYRPDVVILEYVFNDIDYLYPVTPRSSWFDARTVFQQAHPMRLLFFNSFLFQEAYVQIRAIRWSLNDAAPRYDPYADTSLVFTHLRDLERFVATAESAGAAVGIVPVDPRIVASPVARRRYESFVGLAMAAGLPIWRADAAFKDLTLDQVTVSRLDGHPNGLANRLVATEISPMVLTALRSASSTVR